MAAFNKFQQFVLDVSNGKYNLGSDVLKIMLTNTAPVATNTIKSNLTEISAVNGYTAGGPQATLVSNSQTSGTEKLILSAVTITAAGGTIGPFQYAVLYDDTQTTPLKPLIGWWDYGTAISITNGNSFLVQLDQTNGVLQLA